MFSSPTSPYLTAPIYQVFSHLIFPLSFSPESEAQKFQFRLFSYCIIHLKNFLRKLFLIVEKNITKNLLSYLYTSKVNIFALLWNSSPELFLSCKYEAKHPLKQLPFLLPKPLVTTISFLFLWIWPLLYDTLLKNFILDCEAHFN